MFNKSLMCFLLLPALLLTGCIITGKVIAEDGNGIEGVTVTLNGSADLTTTTNSKGGYIFGNFFDVVLGGTSDDLVLIMPGSYTVTPSKTGCSFTPTNIAISVTAKSYGRLGGNIPWPVGGVNFFGEILWGSLDCRSHAAWGSPVNAFAGQSDAFVANLTGEEFPWEFFYAAFIKQKESSPRVGFEILEIQSFKSIRAWISSDITREEFDALDLPAGWFKNQPREGEPDASRFLRSPGAAVDGEFLDKDLFGFSWRHSATVTQANIPLDKQGLLIGSTVAKFHEVTFNAGRTISVLFSPEVEPYVRISRDANRTSDEPSIPNSWRLVEYPAPEKIVIQLPEETLVIRADNEDSFQGPAPELAVAF
jgi:hypothetical protein